MYACVLLLSVMIMDICVMIICTIEDGSLHTLSWLCLQTAWNIPENYVMALEASDRLIDIIWVKWKCTCGCISRPTFKLSASLLDNIGKSKPQDLRKTFAHLYKFIFGSNFQTPEGTMLICTNDSMQVLTPWDHTAIIPLRKETRSFRFLEINVLWCEKCKSMPE